MKGYITKNFRWEEFENSSKAAELGIDNTIPDDTVADNIRALGIQGSAAPQGRLRTSAKNQLGLPLQGCTTRSYTSPQSVTARNADKSSYKAKFKERL